MSVMSGRDGSGRRTGTGGAPEDGASTPASRTARKPLRAFGFRVPSLPRLVGVEIALGVLGTAAVLLDVPARIVWAIAVPLCVLPFFVVAGRSLFDWAGTTLRYLRGSSPSLGVTVDYATVDGDVVGIHWRGNRVTCVLELKAPVGSTTVLGRSRASVSSTLDLTTIASCFSQHDISVARIDVVSHGYRTSSGSPATEVYEQLIGPLPAVALRTVWVAVTIDVSTNRHAVDARGGGRLGVSRVVTVAVERVARALRSAGIQSSVLGRAEINSAAGHLCRGVPYDALTQTWESVPFPGVVHSSFGFDCRTIDEALLTDLWSTLALSTTVAIGLTPTEGSDHIAMRGTCSFVTRSGRPTLDLPGAISMNGRQREALLMSLPLAVTAPGFADPVRRVGYEHSRSLRLPTSGCGQLLGSDASGHGIAARIFGTGVSSVVVAGELYLAQQLVFRAVATGARALLCTDRPHAWGALVDSVGSPDRLRIDGVAHRSTGRFDLVVHDYSESVDGPVGHRADRATVLTLTEHPSRTPTADPDVSIVQPGAAGDRIDVRTRSEEVSLVLVTIPQETAFIGHPRSIRRPMTTY
jgi:type VII secretion protein EccE